MKRIYLFPGKLAASAEPAEITTILGSCVAVALCDSELGIGGLNHFLLAEPPVHERPSERYGAQAIPMLISALIKLGARAGSLEAKLYGGASVLGDCSIGTQIGKGNIEIAERLLQSEGIPVLERNVGDVKARHIILTTSDFKVAHRFQSSAQEVTVKPRVVIIDESASMRVQMRTSLEAAGIEVVGAVADAYQARDLIVRAKPDVITMDIQMPKVSGVQFLEILMRHLPTPVVMVSSVSPRTDDALRALELGAVDLVTKPMGADPSEARRFSEELCKKVKSAASLAIAANKRKVA